MSMKTAVSVAVFAVLVLTLGLAGTAGARSMELGEGAMFGDADSPRDIQETIWFQGFVADPGTGEPVNDTYTVTARMYDAEFGGASVWGPESYVATVIVDGWFNIELGAVIGGLPAFDTPPYYLQLTINSETLTPRLKLASVPSAFQSLGADNGLNLPYSGNYYGLMADAFSITNTGGSICGHFRINNAGSTAGALYGRHNGAGPAVMGWHDGTGSAIKGVANGSGYAGEFEGEVVISDSLKVEGFTLMLGNATVADTLLVVEGFWFPKEPVEGYVLRCADSWGTAEWGPPNLIDRHNESSTTIIGSSVMQYDDAEVTLTVPGPGYIVVTSNVWVIISHTSGTADHLELNHSTNPGSNGVAFTRVCEDIPSSYPTDTNLDRTFSVHSTHEVTSADTYTYYLVGRMSSGQDEGDKFWYAQTTGIYYPYPIPVMAASDEDAEFLKKKAEFENQ